MGSSTKTPDCQCVACKQFRADGEEFLTATRRIARYLPPDALEQARKLVEEKGCDLCKRDAHRALFVPQVIKTFFGIEHLCEWCRNRIDYQRRALKWPICWGLTPDDELKWFLLHDALEQFNLEVRRLSPAAIAKERAHREWLDSLPKYEPEPPQELKIRVRRRVNADVRA